MISWASLLVKLFLSERRLMESFPLWSLMHLKLLKLQVYLWFPEFLKEDWEAKPSVIRPLSCGTSYQFMSISNFEIRLKTFLFDKNIVRNGSGDTKTISVANKAKLFPNYAAGQKKTYCSHWSRTAGFLLSCYRPRLLGGLIWHIFTHFTLFFSPFISSYDIMDILRYCCH